MLLMETVLGETEEHPLAAELLAHTLVKQLLHQGEK